MSTIGSNIAALKSLHNLRLNEDGFAKATERLSSGKRLNSAGDDLLEPQLSIECLHRLPE